MKFILEDKYIKFGSPRENSIITTPIGSHNIKINTITKVATKQLGIKCQCDISKLVGPIVLLETGLLGTLRICGDIIITCIEMGYDLGDKNDCKKIKKNKDLINKRYEELLKEKPKLFDMNEVKEINFSNPSPSQIEKESESDEGKYFYQELHKNFDKSQKELTCDYCTQYETIIDSSLLDLLQFNVDLKSANHEGNRWAYTKNGNIWNDLQGDTFYLDPEPIDIYITHLVGEQKSFLGKSPKKIKTIQICENCFNIFQWKYNIDKINFTGAEQLIESEDLNLLTKIKTNLNLMYKVSDYPGFAKAIFNTKSKENINMIVSKLNMLPKKIEEINNNIRKEKNEIIKLLKDKGVKITVSDITTILRKKDRDKVDGLCKILYEDGEIDFAGNSRYYIMSEDKKVPNDGLSSSIKNSKKDIQSELKKYKELLDEGLIDESDYNAKKKELLGL